MKLNSISTKRFLAVIQFALIAIWIANLADTEAYFITYALCAASAVACLLDNYNHNREIGVFGKVIGAMLAVLFGLIIVMANYGLFQIIRDPNMVSAGTNKLLNLINAALTFLGGAVAAWNVLRWMFSRIPFELEFVFRPRKQPVRVFLGVFVAIAAINLVYHFFVIYPGTLTLDSLSQLEQIRDGIYSNHHPFWHTMVIKVCVEIGYLLFGDVNQAVSVYSVVQILMMAACFAYVIMTLYQAGVPRLWMVLSFAVYAFLPYNIAYSSTMWKDVLFGGAVCVFLTAMYRILKQISKKQLWDYVVFAVSGIGFCVWRSNGFLALVAAFFVFLITLWKDHKKLLLVLFGVIVAGWVMKGPVLDTMNVAEPDLVESLSIPVQQVARVIVDGGELTQEEYELLDMVMDVERVPELYQSHISDNIKNEIRRKDNAYFEANTGQFFTLWLNLLKRYPVTYVQAWVDQTKGYWGGGYYNWIYAQFVNENDMGLALAEKNGIVATLFWNYFGLVRNVNLFQPLHSIGLHTWLLAIFCVANFLKKRREWLLSVPLLMIILTLMVATPVAAEFRYAYAIFTAFPLVACVSLYGRPEKEM